MDSDLDKMEALLEQAEGGPSPEWCAEQLASMRQWRGEYDVVAPGDIKFNQMYLLVRFAMPLHTTKETTCS